MDMSKTLSDLPMDLHRLILSHDEEKIELKKENEKLKTRVKMLQCLLDEARQDSDSDEDTDEECVYCFYICRYCFAFGTEDPDCTKCGKKMCVLLYNEPNSSMALAKAQFKNDNEDE